LKGTLVNTGAVIVGSLINNLLPALAYAVLWASFWI